MFDYGAALASIARSFRTPELAVQEVALARAITNAQDRIAELTRREEPMMKTPKLVRVETIPDVQPTVSTLDTEIAQQAAVRLGYGEAAKKVYEETAEARLMCVLRELDIKPFTKQSVQAYKQAMRDKAYADYQYGGYYRPEISWKSTAISSYKKAVPTYALHTALQVQEKMPEAQFYVDELIVESRAPDPFLYVAVGKKRFYLDVWDEPTFKGERKF